MIRKTIILLTMFFAVEASWGEAIRTRLTKENKFPAKGGLEAGLSFDHIEFEDGREDDIWTPYARFGVTEHLALFATLPLVDTENAAGDSESGLGDVTLGFDLLAWEDIFKYPYVVPHAEIVFYTGDEDDGLGRGETVYVIGLAVGTTVEDICHIHGTWDFALDARYRFQDDENVPSIALSVLWNISPRLAFMAEVEVRDEDEVEEDEDESDHPATYVGGIYYKITDALGIGLYGGADQNSIKDEFALSTLSYTF